MLSRRYCTGLSLVFLYKRCIVPVGQKNVKPLLKENCTTFWDAVNNFLSISPGSAFRRIVDQTASSGFLQPV
jgi:hypothetical protein